MPIKAKNGDIFCLATTVLANLKINFYHKAGIMFRNLHIICCLVLIASCNKGNFGSGDDSQLTVKTKVLVVSDAVATQASDGRGAVVVKTGNKLVAECLAPDPCPLKFVEEEKDNGKLFVYKAPFSYKIDDKLMAGKTLKCVVKISISGSKNKVDNKARDLALYFCPNRGDGRDCDTKDMVEECPIL